MKFCIKDTFFSDVKILTPHVIQDDRGFFMEVFNEKDFKDAGLPTKFVQMNHSFSAKNVVRGLHFQWEPMMGKLMRVTSGSAFLVAVDIRKNSPTLGNWIGEILSAQNKKQMWAPAGFARGFYTLSDATEVQYLVTGLYDSRNDSEILWSDAQIGINWPINGKPILSIKDENAQTLQQWLSSPNSNKFKY